MSIEQMQNLVIARIKETKSIELLDLINEMLVFERG